MYQKKNGTNLSPFFLMTRAQPAFLWYLKYLPSIGFYIFYQSEMIIAGEGSYGGRRYIKLLDPDMNIVVVLESGFDYAYFSDGERNVVNNPGEIMGMESFQKKK